MDYKKIIEISKITGEGVCEGCGNTKEVSWLYTDEDGGDFPICEMCHELKKHNIIR